MIYERIQPLRPDFADAEAVSVERLRDAWVEQRSGLAESGALGRFQERLIRRWSIETGIIERLYTLDRGTTEILITRGLDAALVEHGASDLPAPALIRILEDHREAAQYVFDHVTQQRPLTLHFIRSLHDLLTRNQDTVEVEDQHGQRFKAELRRGDWKVHANNPRRPDGTMHAYCPPELVQEEMESLLRYYGTLDSATVPAIIRAAWLHHRFTQIHPFQDGNGRVARALTAFTLVRDDCFPIVVDRDQRSVYIDALEVADAGDLRPLVLLFARLEKRQLEEALSLSEASLDAPTAPGTTMRQTLLAALAERAHEKRSALTAKRTAVMQVGKKVFDEVVRVGVTALAEDVQTVLETALPGSGARVEWADDQTRHYFKSQIVRIAQEEGYFCDLETFHEWVRLRLERPSEADKEVSEIVFSLHSLGRHFTGVLALSAYFATRILDEDGRSVALQPKPLADRSLTFSYREEEGNIAPRVQTWVEKALDIGLAELQRSL